jgi:hypothetical protein
VTVGQSEAAGDVRLAGWAYTSMLAFGAGLGALSVVLYGTTGFSVATKVTWAAGFAVLALAFRSRTKPLSRIAVADILAPAAVVALLSPLYVVNVYDWPVQVGSDEIAIMTVAERWAGGNGADLFGPSDYLGHPALLFVVWGSAAELFGEVDLTTMRTLHGAVSLLAVFASYFLFRQLLPRRWALVATALLGLTHSLFVIGRLAMRESSSLLVELVALALLLRGLRHNAPFPTFLGGAVAGLGFYVYQPARATMLLWLLFLGALLLFARDRFAAGRLGRDAAIALSACALVASPIVIAEQKAPDDEVSLTRGSLLFFEEARELQQEWVFADSQWEGIRTNIGYGLAAYNNNVVDHGWIYINWGHGFVDPLTGALLWLGAVLVGWRALRKRDAMALLPLTAFLFLWLSFAFVVNKAPNYTRMLITLPFVAYFVAEAIRAGAKLASRVWQQPGRRRLVTLLVAALVVGAIGAWNIAIAGEYVREGRQKGDDIGSTGRYVQARRDIPRISFHLAASDRWPYYIWGFPHMWYDRLRMFAREGQVQPIVSPAEVNRLVARRPFVLFLSGALWERHREALERRYPDGELNNVMSDGSRVAFEVLR